MNELNNQTLLETVGVMTGIPAAELADPVSLLRRIPRIEGQLNVRLVGQHRAVEVVIQALRARLLRKSSERPVLNLLCAGPSGVGKTELARQLAAVCLG